LNHLVGVIRSNYSPIKTLPDLTPAIKRLKNKKKRVRCRF